MTRPRPRIGSEILPVVLILGCLAGSWSLIVAMHRRAVSVRSAAKAVKPPSVALSPPPKPADSPPQPAVPEPEAPPPPPPEDPTRPILARIGAEEAEQLLEARAADRKAEAHERAAKAAAAEAERWRRREQLAREQVSTLAESARALDQEADALALERDVLERERDAAKAELTKARTRSSYAVLPHRGANGTWRRPIVIECRNGTATLQPGGPTFTMLDLSGLIALRSSPIVVAVVRELIRIQGKTAPDGTPAVPYIFFVIRPDGIRPYYEARARLEALSMAFGYELVDQDQVIDYPELDNPDEWDGSGPKRPLPRFANATSRFGPSALTKPKDAGGDPTDEFRWPARSAEGTGGSGGPPEDGAPATLDPADLGVSPVAAGGANGFPSGLSDSPRVGSTWGQVSGNRGGGIGSGGATGLVPPSTRAGTPGMPPPSGRPLASRSLPGTVGGADDGTAQPFPNGRRGGSDGLLPDGSLPNGASGSAGPSFGAGANGGQPGSVGPGRLGPLASSPNGTGPNGPTRSGGDDGTGNPAAATGPGGVSMPPPGQASNGFLIPLPGTNVTGSPNQPPPASATKPAGGMPPDDSAANPPGSLAQTPQEGESRPASSTANSTAEGSNRKRIRYGTASADANSSSSGDGSPSGSSGAEPGLGSLGGTSTQPAPKGRANRREEKPLVIDVPMEIVVACGPSGIVIHPGGYRLTSKALKSKDSVLAKSLKTIVHQRQMVDPMIHPHPTLRFLVEPGGGESYREARRQTVLSGLDWPSELQVSDTRVLDFFPRERF
jgi:hypothetical protein